MFYCLLLYDVFCILAFKNLRILLAIKLLDMAIVSVTIDATPLGSVSGKGNEEEALLLTPCRPPVFTSSLLTTISSFYEY